MLLSGIREQTTAGAAVAPCKENDHGWLRRQFRFALIKNNKYPHQMRTLCF